MEPKRRRWRASACLIIATLSSCVSPTRWADGEGPGSTGATQNDMGTGEDAGDTFDDATTPRVLSGTGAIAGEDAKDFFKLALLHGQVIRIALTNDADVTVRFLDPNNAELLGSPSPTDPGSHAWVIDAPGDYRIEVSSGNADAVYGLGIQVEGRGYEPCAIPAGSATVVNVRDFDAKGDGVSNDTKAIQDAIESLGGNGGTVLVPDGVYMIQTDYVPFSGNYGLELRDGVTLRMEPHATLKAIPSALDGASVIALYGVQNVSIIGGTIEGDRYEHQSTTEGENVSGIHVGTVSNFAIEGVTVKNFWGDGILLGRSSDAGPADHVTLCGVVADRNRNAGVRVAVGDGVVLRDSVFANTNDGEYPGYGVYIRAFEEEVRGVIVENNQFLNNESAGLGLSAGDDTDPPSIVVDCTVRGNLASGNFVGFEFHNTSGHVVEENDVVRNGTVGIYMTQGAHDVAISNNTITDNGHGAIELDDASDNRFENNLFAANSQSQDRGFDNLELWGISSRNHIEGNVVRAGNGKILPEWGIRIGQLECADNEIIDNDLRESGAEGSIVDEGTNTIVSGNQE